VLRSMEAAPKDVVASAASEAMHDADYGGRMTTITMAGLV
jgi:hypothetical protein